MATRVLEFPFVGGIDQNTDRALLDAHSLTLAQNVRMDRAGRLQVRPQYTALGTSTYSANTMFAYDLSNYSGRLVALGDQVGVSRPTDLFELVNAEAVWRGQAQDDVTTATGIRLPRATALRELGRLPDVRSPVTSVSLATNGTLICAAINMSSGNSAVHIFDPRTDQTVFTGTLQLQRVRAVFAGSNFWLVGTDLTGVSVFGQRFNPATDETISGTTTFATTASSLLDIAAAQTGASDFTVAFANGTGVNWVRMNSAGVVQAGPINATANIPFAIAVCGNSAGTRITTSWHEQIGGAYRLRAQTQTGAAVVGPTALFGGAVATFGRLGMQQQGSKISIVGVQTGSVAGTNTVTQLCTNESAHTLDTTITLFDSFPVSQPVYVANGGGDEFYYGAANSLATATNIGTNLLIEQSTRVPQCGKDGGQVLALLGSANDISGGCAIGTKAYWGNWTVSFDGQRSFRITEVELGDTGRRQMSQLGNELHIAGAMPLVYDSRFLAEQNFTEIPVVTSLVGSTSFGGKSLLGRYSIAVVWRVVDARGRLAASAVSVPAQITLTGTQNTISGTYSVPHSLRSHPNLTAGTSYALQISLYCSAANDSTFFLEATVFASANANFGEPQTFTLTASDVANSTQPVIYKQEQTPLDNIAPPPYQYSWPARERIFVGGLPDTEQWAASKLAFPGEPVNWADIGEIGFQGRANRPITAVGSFETENLVWTADEILRIGGRGPERNGAGDFEAALTIPSPGGCLRWQSLVLSPPGFFFQMTSDQLMLLARAGEVSFIGAQIQDTLALFPTITAAVHVRTQQIVAFACTDGVNSVILLYDLFQQLWTVDTVSGVVVSLSELNGQLAFIVGGVVFVQDVNPASGVGTLPSISVRTGSYRLFGGLGYGTLCKVGLLGTFLGDCTVEGFVSYDDTKTWTSMGQQTVTTAALGYASQDPVTIAYTPARREVDRFAIRFDVTNGVNTGGIRLHSLSLEVEAQEFITRRPAREQR